MLSCIGGPCSQILRDQVLLYGYARGLRSSRKIERACVEDVSFRVVGANQAPDHATVARFRQRHEAALACLFGDVFEPCVEAGLVEVGMVAIDGTRVNANAGREANTSTRRSRRRFWRRPTRSTATRTSASASFERG